MRKFVAMMLGLLLICSFAIPAVAAAGGAGGAVTDQLGRPILGAEVEVYRLGQGLVSVQSTGASGRFTVPGPVAPGSLWQFRVSAKGFRTKDTGWTDLVQNAYQSVQLMSMTGTLRLAAVTADGKPTAAAMLVVGPDGQVLADGQELDGRLELGDLAPGQYRAVVQGAGTATAARIIQVPADGVTSVLLTLESGAIGVTGEVRDAVTGAPLPGAAIELLRDDQALLVDAGSTDATGRFRVGLATGETGSVKLRVSAEGYRSFTTAPFSLAGGQEKDFSAADAIQLTPAVTTVAGTLISVSGLPISRRELRLEAKGFGYVTTAQSDSDGSFRFERVQSDPNAVYRVSVTGEDEAASTGWTALAPGATDQLLLQLESGVATTYGNSSLSGKVVAPDDTPLSGAKVEIYRRNHLVQSLTTDATGTFVAKDLSATQGWNMVSDPYVVKVSKDGFITSSEATTGGKAAEVHVPKDTRATYRFMLRPERYTVRGRVVGPKGEAVPDAEVWLVSGRNQPVTSSVRTDAGGWYQFSALPTLPAVDMALRVKAAGYRPVSGVPVVPGSEEIVSQPPVRMTEDGPTFTGQVLDWRGSPVPFADVELRLPAGGVSAKVSADLNGIYRIEQPLPVVGTAALIAGKEHWNRSGAVIDLAQAGDTVNRDLVIAPATVQLSGRVAAADGTPAAGVWVELLQEGRGVVATVKTDGDGLYSFTDITPAGGGWFWLRVRGDGVTFAGSLRHGTELVPLLQVSGGEEIVTDLLVR